MKATKRNWTIWLDSDDPVNGDEQQLVEDAHKAFQLRMGMSIPISQWQKAAIVRAAFGELATTPPYKRRKQG